MEQENICPEEIYVLSQWFLTYLEVSNPNEAPHTLVKHPQIWPKKKIFFLINTKNCIKIQD